MTGKQKTKHVPLTRVKYEELDEGVRKIVDYMRRHLAELLVKNGSGISFDDALSGVMSCTSMGICRWCSGTMVR
jgi:hypothetical protein